MTSEKLELLTDNRDFTALFYVILKRESSEWLESSIESDLGIRFVVWSFTSPFTILFSSNTLCSARTGYLKKCLTFREGICAKKGRFFFSRSSPRARLALRACLAFASFRLKYAKNYACSTGWGKTEGKQCATKQKETEEQLPRRNYKEAFLTDMQSKIQSI